MEENVYMRMISTLLIDETMKALTEAAEINNRLYDDEYNENMFLIGMIGNAIATGKDKMYIIELFKDIAKHQQDDDENLLLEKAKRYIKNA